MIQKTQTSIELAFNTWKDNKLVKVKNLTHMNCIAPVMLTVKNIAQKSSLKVLTQEKSIGNRRGRIAGLMSKQL